VLYGGAADAKLLVPHSEFPAHRCHVKARMPLSDPVDDLHQGEAQTALQQTGPNGLGTEAYAEGAMAIRLVGAAETPEFQSDVARTSELA
jgi:hypothetical protein